MFDYGDIECIYVLSGAWPMRRNDYRDMDSDGCMRKSTGTGDKNDYSESSCGTCIYQCAIGCNGSMWIDTISTDSRLQ